MKYSFLNNLQKCEYKVYSLTFVGDVIAKIFKSIDEYHYLVNSDNSIYGHSCEPRTYSDMIAEGCEFYISEEEFELLRKNKKMWFVDSFSLVNIFENDNNKPNLITTVDENGKIIITKE